jgi:hypothetical protein
MKYVWRDTVTWQLKPEQWSQKGWPSLGNGQSVYLLNQNIARDEFLALWKDHLFFRQYIPLRAAMFGIKSVNPALYIHRMWHGDEKSVCELRHKNYYQAGKMSSQSWPYFVDVQFL